MVDKDLLMAIKERERKKFLAHLQALAEKEGQIPSMPFLFLRKMAQPLRYTGGFLLGLFIGIFTIIVAYLIGIILLHIL